MISRILPAFVCLSVMAANQAATPSVSEQLDQYAEWAAGARQDVNLVPVNPDAARTELARVAQPFLRRGNHVPPLPETYERQRRILVTFALELAATGAKKEAGGAARLVEWACPYVRGHSPLTEFDRAWQLAALAILEGGIDGRALSAHLDHAQMFQPEPRLLLARAIAEEQAVAPSEMTAAAAVQTPALVPESDRVRIAVERAIARFREAGQVEDVHAEAALRMGHVQLMAKRYEEALVTWKDVQNTGRDLALTYLVQLFRGLAYEGLHREADAIDAYTAAARVSPGAHSVSIRLAALAFRSGRTADSNAIVSSLLKDDDPRRDPWWAYYAADWRFWYPRIERLRALMKS